MLIPLPWWIALCVLALNDHVLKGSGILPGVVTGKLSDFAGLIVAPVLASMVLRVRSDRGRAAVFAAVYGAFAAIKLSPMLALQAGELLTSLGVRSRIWCDPTDLIALVVLPWAFRIARDAQVAKLQLSATASARAAWSRRIGIATAAVACIATSEDGPEEEETQLFPPFVINWTRAPIDVQISARSFPCSDAGDDSDAGTLDLGAPRIETIEPRQLYLLNEEGGLAQLSPGRCGIAVLRAPGAGEARVSWTARAAVPITRDVIQSYDRYGDDWAWEIAPEDDWAFERAITISGASSAPEWVAGPDITLEVGE